MTRVAASIFRVATLGTVCSFLFSISPLMSETINQPAPLEASGCVTTKAFIPRSQGTNSARQLVGNATHLYHMRTQKYCQENEQQPERKRSYLGGIKNSQENYSNNNHDNYFQHYDLQALFAITAEYSQTFFPHRIGRCLFGNDYISCGKTHGIKIQGRNVANRDPRAWLADYFYLPQDFSSIVRISPEIKNFMVDFDFYAELNGCIDCLDGLYFRIHGPLTYTRWSLNFDEDIIRRGTDDHPEGYFTPLPLARSFLLSSFRSYAGGFSPGSGRIRQTYTFEGQGNDFILPTPGGASQEVVVNWETAFEGLRFARMECRDNTLISFADLRAELGFNVIHTDCYHIGFNIQAAAPTGNRRDPCFLFAPIVGNGHHWELGAGAHGHMLLWKSEDEDTEWGIHATIALTHLFPDLQKRTFELRGRPNSAYMLVQRGAEKKIVATDVPREVIISPTESRTEFNTTLYMTRTIMPDDIFAFAPLANISTLDVKVSADLQVDAAIMMNVKACGFSFDCGYNFWMRSCEKFDLKKIKNFNHCNEVSTTLGSPGGEHIWSLKGTAQVFGYDNGVTAADLSQRFPGVDAIRLPVSESRATIHRGTAPSGSPQNDQIVNAEVDNPAIATTGSFRHAPSGEFDFPLTYSSTIVNTSPDADAARIYASIAPITLTCNDLDLVRTRGLSHKIFGHIGYHFDDECWQPSIGVGGSAEFGNHDTCMDQCTKLCEQSCTKCSVSQWAVWLKGSLIFN